MAKKFPVVLLIVLFSLAAAAAAQNDIKGSADHPALSRYPDARIMYYTAKEYDEYRLITGKKEGRDTPAKGERLEGKVTQITYAAPAERSTLEIFRNYEAALKKAGFETLFSGRSDDMGSRWIDDFIGAAVRAPKDSIGADPGTRLNRSDFHYLAAKKDGGDKVIYVAVCSALGWFQKFPIVQVDIIEAKPMDTGLIKADASAFEKAIKEKGTVPVYGIFFDTARAEIKPGSEQVLKEIAALLKKNTKLNIYVVGHTDNTGQYESNMELSKKRAESVVSVLAGEYGINRERLQPAGVGPVAPVASNTTPEGKEKNRRVELVER
ncbi:MAG TPA: DUF4892 domain-containing protein [bacterium]|nr:DUF4892 domain-containing protein [bacterium]